MAIARASALLLAALAVAAAAESPSRATSAVLQLHRLPRRAAEAHPERYHRRRLIQQAPESGEGDAPAPMEAVPLHIGLGTHYTWVYAGTPPQRASVIVDTGSGILAFPCSGCDGCGDHTDRQFNASASATLVHVTCAAHDYFKCQGCHLETDSCAISQSYMEGSSWDATVVEDVVFLGGDASAADAAARDKFGTHFKFGCQHAETGLFVEQVADGIMGLSNTDHHVVAKLHRENKIPSKLFALCFAEDGGAMAIGAPDASRHRGAVRYAKLLGDRSSGNFYNVRLMDILIGGKSIEAESSAYTRGRFIVDSGTTDSYLPRAVKDEFMSTFLAVSGLAYSVAAGSTCNGFTAAQAEALPLVQLVLEADDGGSMTLDVSPAQYLLEGDGGYCGGIFLSEHSGGVIGANLMMNRDVIFDGGAQRVGFVDADCTYTAGDAAVVTLDSPASTPKQASAADKTSADPSPTAASASASSTVAPTDAPATSAAPAATTAAASVETSAPAANETEESAEAAANETVATNTELGAGSAAQEADDHPMVLTVVGTVLAVAFLLIVVASVRHKKNRKKAQNWSRVNEDEGDADADAELGLVGARGKRSKGSGKPKHQPLAASADDSGSDSDSDSDGDSDSDEEDAIFDRQTDAHAARHESSVLEQL